MTLPELVLNQADRKLRPHNTVTAILTAEELDSCLAALTGSGVDSATVDVLLCWSEAI